jgi:hypothetical protein
VFRFFCFLQAFLKPLGIGHQVNQIFPDYCPAVRSSFSVDAIFIPLLREEPMLKTLSLFFVPPVNTIKLDVIKNKVLGSSSQATLAMTNP